MSPLDDELRAALHGRARSLSPSPDPLAGIERRAGAIRRRRTAASVTGSTLAVAAVALAVATLAPSATGPAPQVASSTAPTPSASAPVPPPVPSPTAVLPATSGALDPDDPWAYRGTPLDQLGEGTLATFQREYAAMRGVEESALRFTPLFGQVDEPSQRTELVFLATVDGEHRWGVMASSEAGPELHTDEDLPSPALALATGLPGDEVPRLLVVAAPGSGDVQYGPDDASEWTPLTETADGVWTGPLDGDPQRDLYRLVDSSGTELVRGDAPDPAPSGSEVAAAPQNLLDWPARGEAAPELVERALEIFAQGQRASREDVDGRVLFGGGDDTGREYVFLQAWQLGQDAHTVGLIAGGGQPETPFLGPAIDRGSAVLAFVVPAGTGQSTDTLVVVPDPAAGQVLYAPDATTDPVPVESRYDGVWLIDRSTRPDDDRLIVLDRDGDGDLRAPVYRGSVMPLLCGVKECG